MYNPEDLSVMSTDELNQVEADILREKDSRRKARINAIREEVRKAAEELGMSIEEILGDVYIPKPKVKPKYHNPHNPSETWTGRGKTPRWVRDALESGMSMDDLLIRDSQ